MRTRVPARRPAPDLTAPRLLPELFQGPPPPCLPRAESTLSMLGALNSESRGRPALLGEYRFAHRALLNGYLTALRPGRSRSQLEGKGGYAFNGTSGSAGTIVDVFALHGEAISQELLATLTSCRRSEQCA